MKHVQNGEYPADGAGSKMAKVGVGLREEQNGKKKRPAGRKPYPWTMFVTSSPRGLSPRVAAGRHVRQSGLPITVMLQLMGPLAVCSSAEPRRRGVHEGAVHGFVRHVKA